ncbi:MAG: CARDB domain-containing protein [Gammaproteobacteria bacterium]|nr:CARDB domain-containing protein [Gammaproteobacteria bacterium]
MTNKLIRSLLFVLATALAVPFASAGPSVSTPMKPLKMAPPKTTAKPNLVIDAVRWSGEFCGLYGCKAAEDIKHDLQVNKATCALKVRVRNKGGAAAGAFQVQLLYTHWKGRALLQKVKGVGGGLAAGAVTEVVFPAADIGYYYTGAPFKAKVDYRNQVSESNEDDNTGQLNNP